VASSDQIVGASEALTGYRIFSIGESINIKLVIKIVKITAPRSGEVNGIPHGHHALDLVEVALRRDEVDEEPL
jgi:hypothetical protein